MSADTTTLTAATSLPPPPKTPAGVAPWRAPGTVRRTSSIEIDWPGGAGGPMRATGRARDILTPADTTAITRLAEDAFEAEITAERRITAITTVPPRGNAQALVGERAGARLRTAITQALPGERDAATPLYLILDDIAGTSLISPWAWSLWDPDWVARMERLKADPKTVGNFDRENICAGLRTGSSGLSFMASGTDAGELRDPADTAGWHAFADRDGPNMRRARRIDIRRDDLIRIDAHFQDSASTPDGPRAALHEYRIRATADPRTLVLLSLEAEPRVLPFAECPAAAANMVRLIGAPLPDLRQTVLDELKGPAGCTHLNDALRALAEVPILLHQAARET